MVSRGAFVVFEGIDRSGKSTQVSSILTKLPHCIKQSFPDRTTVIGNVINSYLSGSVDLSDEAVHCLFSANRWEIMTSLTKSLEDGITVIADRYAYSGVAYSAAKGLDLNWCKGPDRGLLKPDLVVYLNLDPVLASNRSDYGSEVYEKLDFQVKVSSQFKTLVDSDFLVVDATMPRQVISEQIEAAVANLFKSPLPPLQHSLFL